MQRSEETEKVWLESVNRGVSENKTKNHVQAILQILLYTIFKGFNFYPSGNH